MDRSDPRRPMTLHKSTYPVGTSLGATSQRDSLHMERSSTLDMPVITSGGGLAVEETVHLNAGVCYLHANVAFGHSTFLYVDFLLTILTISIESLWTNLELIGGP